MREGIQTTGIAIIYASSFGGHVAETAKYMAKELDADIFDLKKQTKINMTSYNRVIIGTGIHAGKPFGKVVSFVKDNKAVLDDKKTSLFICCMYYKSLEYSKHNQGEYYLLPKFRNFPNVAKG